MKKTDWLKRYGMFIAGVIFSALGISLITKAGLGTSPITSLAYVGTFLYPQSLGTFTMLVNSVMFLLQVILLGKTFEKVQLLQLPGEGLVRVIAGLTGWRFGRVKTGFDLSIVACAILLSLVAKGQVLGIREGTVIAALIVGNISHFFIDKVSAMLAGWIPTYRSADAADVCSE